MQEAAMQTGTLMVALGDRRYRIERPWGDLPTGPVSDVTIDSRGHVFVLLRWDPLADTTSPRVIELSPEGKRLAAWGEKLIADSHMLAAASDDRLFIVDRDVHEVVICRPNGERIGGLGKRNAPLEPFNHPTDVAIAPKGDIYVSDGYAGHRVHRFSPDGKLVRSWGSLGDEPGQFVNPHAVWVVSDGRVVTVDRENDRLQVFAPDGDLLDVWTGFRKPMDVWGDADDNLFVTDLVPTLSMLAPDGRRLGRCRPVLNGAHGIWGDKQGRLYLAEPNPSRLTRLTPIDTDVASRGV
jgi:DNA-binding beta-propeller fold protein YncE